jgi:hypothetical protein
MRRVLLVALIGALSLLSLPAESTPKQYPWQKAPGPIAGRWVIACADAQGTQIAVSISGTTATATVVSPKGSIKARGYKAGETILKLAADDHGDWVGKLRWKSVSGDKRWDPIRLVASSQQLNATMTTDSCFQKMPKGR